MLDRIIELFAAKKKNKSKLSLSPKVEPIEIRPNLQDLSIKIEVHDRRRFEKLNKEVFRKLYMKSQNGHFGTLLINNNVKFEIILNLSSKLHKLASKIPVTDSDIKRMKVLFKTKRYINISDHNGNTPLHIAVLKENLPIIELLISYDAGLFLKNNDGETPYQLSFESFLVKNLFHSDSNINEKVRVQKFNYNICKLSEVQEIESQIGPVATYATLPNIDGPVSTLKEMCIDSILHSVIKR
ncbi:ankyrin repeat domain-containing protein [Candidatus Mesenet endosymbiont of Phosphuga atrata]|uniref:ankyrin repeat domain-containing protein n=1 Tax=Candidatus Mesenet endosymbiont of Phosphuga atrata TaxID=3066221 RepID=UPI0030D08083